MELLAEALDNWPECPGAAQDLARMHAEAAALCASAGKWDACREHVERSLALHPGQPLALGLRETLRRAGRDEQAQTRGRKQKRERKVR
jgi:hypothetical protein